MTDIPLLYDVLKSTPMKYWIIRIKTPDASVIIPELRVKDLLLIFSSYIRTDFNVTNIDNQEDLKYGMAMIVESTDRSHPQPVIFYYEDQHLQCP